MVVGLSGVGTSNRARKNPRTDRRSMTLRPADRLGMRGFAVAVSGSNEHDNHLTHSLMIPGRTVTSIAPAPIAGMTRKTPAIAETARIQVRSGRSASTHPPPPQPHGRNPRPLGRSRRQSHPGLPRRRSTVDRGLFLADWVTDPPWRERAGRSGLAAAR